MPHAAAATTDPGFDLDLESPQPRRARKGKDVARPPSSPSPAAAGVAANASARPTTGERRRELLCFRTLKMVKKKKKTAGSSGPVRDPATRPTAC